MRTRSVFTGLLLCIVASTVGAQSGTPRFDAVYVHVSKVTPPLVGVLNLDCVGRCAEGNAAVLDQGRAMFTGIPMARVIAAAYGVKVREVVEGPGWLMTDRFEIYARTAPSTPPETLRTMFQALLAERFGLAVHREDRLMPAYSLEIGAGKPRLQEAVDSAAPACKSGFMPTPTGPMTNLTCKSQTMAGLASLLGSAHLPDTVTDATGIQGAFDFTLIFKPVGALIRMDSDPRFDPSTDVSIFDAVSRLGLKLERTSKPMPVLVVDHMNRVPSTVPSEAEHLPPVPTEFEVASVRPIQPDTPFQSDRYLPGGQVEMHGWTLRRLIKLVYNVEDDGIVNAPKWLNDDRFDILAKTSLTRDELQVARAANGLTTLAPVMYAEMLQKLLAQRFKLVVHNDVQPVSAFLLTTAEHGHKLKESSPSARSQCTDTTGPGSPEIYTCQNITMAQFAPNLHAIAPVYLNHPVVDMTGLKGAYDLTLKWHWAPLTNPQGLPGDSTARGGATAGASDPMSYITVFEALEKQLGLKAVLQKHPLPVIVIDHIERVPTGGQ